MYFIELSATLNGFRDRLQVFNKIVSNTKNVTFNGWNAASSDMSFVANADVPKTSGFTLFAHTKLLVQRYKGTEIPVPRAAGLNCPAPKCMEVRA